MSDVNSFEDFDFGELLELDFREKNLIFESEKKRIQKLVEASDIEMTELLFYGHSSINCVPEEKNNATAKNVVDVPVKKLVKKSVKKKAKKSVEPNGVVKVERKKMTLERINEVFGGSDLDPYELE
jgi:hypothetical protein